MQAESGATSCDVALLFAECCTRAWRKGAGKLQETEFEELYRRKVAGKWQKVPLQHLRASYKSQQCCIAGKWQEHDRKQHFQNVPFILLCHVVLTSGDSIVGMLSAIVTRGASRA